MRNADRGTEDSLAAVSQSQVLIIRLEVMELQNGRDRSDGQVVTVRCTGNRWSSWCSA